MASKNARNIGLIILKNLGLTDEEAEVLENQKPEQINTIFTNKICICDLKYSSMKR